MRLVVAMLVVAAWGLGLAPGALAGLGGALDAAPASPVAAPELPAPPAAVPLEPATTVAAPVEAASTVAAPIAAAAGDLVATPAASIASAKPLREVARVVTASGEGVTRALQTLPAASTSKLPPAQQSSAATTPVHKAAKPKRSAPIARAERAAQPLVAVTSWHSAVPSAGIPSRGVTPLPAGTPAEPLGGDFSPLPAPGGFGSSAASGGTAGLILLGALAVSILLRRPEARRRLSSAFGPPRPYPFLLRLERPD